MPTIDEIKLSAAAIEDWAKKELERVEAELKFIEAILEREDKYSELNSILEETKTQEES